VKNMARAIEHHLLFCQTKKLPSYPVAADLLAFSLESYDTDARDRADERAAKRQKKNLPAAEHDQGGRTGAIAIFHGSRNLKVRLGLHFEYEPEFVRQVANFGAYMPTVQQMWPLDGIAALEGCMISTSENEGTRAWAGGLWLLAAASTRPIEFARTGEVDFESYELESGEQVAVAYGVASASKAKSQAAMKPLEWRAPLVPIAAESIDLGPLIKSLPQGTDDGCIFRDYAVPEGRPKCLEHWCGWLDRAAEPKTINDGLRELMGPQIGEKRATGLSLYGARHVIPEIGRGASLPTHRREAVGYWRPKAVVGDANDERAWRQALRVARESRSKNSAMQVMANRYASRAGQPVEQDSTRITCLSLARALFKKRDVSDMSHQAVINAVSEMVQPAILPTVNDAGPSTA
jgi:hypothetical protein